jgi:diacylglycerol kinase (ATP)
LGIGEPGYHPVRKMRTVARGLGDAVLHDFSVAYKLVLSVAMLVAAFFLRDWIDFLLILVATALVLAMEIMNTAVEALCDFIEARHNERIRVIKDMAAAAVGIAILVWLVVLGFEVEEMLRVWLASGS